MRAICLPLLLTSVLFASADSQAGQSYDNCTGFIDSVPTTISTSGTWCMRHDLTSSVSTGALITINGNNINIDCNDFRLGGLAAGPNTRTIGIYTNARNNISVRRCAPRGFFYGIRLIGDNHLVEGNRTDNNTYIGIAVEGSGSVVRDNRVLDTGGTDLVATVRAIGIYSSGDNEILANLINGVVATAGSGARAYGVQSADNLIGSIIDNNIKAILPDGVGQAHAISFSGTTGRVAVDSNNLVGNGGGSTIAISCPVTNDVVMAGNLANGFLVPTDNCAHDGGNLDF